MIYFIQNTVSKIIKIGVSDDPKKRLAALQTGNHDPLVILCTIPGEKAQETSLHRKFASSRVQGEWFRADRSLLAEIDRILKPAPKLLGREIRSVYLAGKVSGTSWRDEILGYEGAHHDWAVAEEDEEWHNGELVPIPGMARKLDYLGPFWRDVLSGHGTPDDSPGPHAYGNSLAWSEGDHDLVRRKCLSGARWAGLVFAWIDSHDCYGTIAEVSAAYSRRDEYPRSPTIAIAIRRGFDDRELWFATGMAHFLDRRSRSPGEAWRRLWTGQISPVRRPPPGDYFWPGDSVVHATFGQGRILDIHGSGPHRQGRIAFDSAGEKRILLDIAGLKLIEDERGCSPCP